MRKDGWSSISRIGYFGRRRDQKIAELNRTYGEGNWRLQWQVMGDVTLDFVSACVCMYEASYYLYLKDRTEDLEFICSHAEVIDNAPTNIASGRDYTRQEAFSTHIQDIAIRNVLFRLGRQFALPPVDTILVVRGEETEGWRFNPGNVPFFCPELITQPSMRPAWAQPGSVEDFWQSNKWLQVKE